MSFFKIFLFSHLLNNFLNCDYIALWSRFCWRILTTAPKIWSIKASFCNENQFCNSIFFYVRVIGGSNYLPKGKFGHWNNFLFFLTFCKNQVICQMTEYCELKDKNSYCRHHITLYLFFLYLWIYNQQVKFLKCNIFLNE